MTRACAWWARLPVPHLLFRLLLRLLLLGGLCAAQPSQATGDDAAAPVALDSPAWRALLQQPLVQDDTLAYHAAALAGAWGRTAEKITLVNALLLLHGQALSGQALPATLGDLLGAPVPSPQTLQAAWDAGLNRAWALPTWESTVLPAGTAAKATPWPGRPGFWRLPGGRLAASPLVQNRATLVMVVPGPLQLVLQGGSGALAMDCTQQRGSVRLLPGEQARWWCTTRAAVPADALATEPRVLWSATVPLLQGDLERWTNQLAGRAPTSLTGLTDLHAQCRQRADCGQGLRTPPVEPPDVRQARLARELEERRRERLPELKRNAARRWYLAALVVAGFGLYALVARHWGRTPATVLAFTALLVIAQVLAAGQGSGGWGALAAAGVFVATLLYGLALVAVYRWLYPVVFGRG